MADRPIIFSGPMVRALLDGSKTQTRRVLKLAGRTPDFIGPSGCQSDPTCWGWEMPNFGGYVTVEGDDKDHLPGWRNGWRDWAGAYAPGDRLYVREAHALVPSSAYRFSAGVPYAVNDEDGWEACIYREGWERSKPGVGWRPSIHMPRWASRLTLTVTDVRVQRLQDISEADAKAEGMISGGLDLDSGDPLYWKPTNQKWPHRYENAKQAFQGLWNSLHGPRPRKRARGSLPPMPSPDAPWDANPWVVALTFTVRRGNIDEESTNG